MGRFVLVMVTLVAATGVTPGLTAGGSTDAGAELVQRFLTRDEPALESYTATRHLEAHNDRFKAAGWMRVRVTLQDGAFAWDVLDEGGSSYVRNKVLRRALEGERDAIRSGAPARAAMTTENYDIRFDGTDVLGMARLRLEPRRRDGFLVRGQVVVTDPEADLVEVRGRLAKNPSWWTTSVDVIRTYGRVAGIRVPVRMQSTATVRIAGRSRFDMTTHYETVNGRVLAGHTEAGVVLRGPGARPRSRTTAARTSSWNGLGGRSVTHAGHLARATSTRDG